MGTCCSVKSTTISINVPRQTHDQIIHPSSSPESVTDYYKIDKVIGLGHFGTVRCATKKSMPTQKFAIKTIDKEKFKHSSEISQLKREIEILLTVDHPNIIKLYESYEDRKYIHLVTEYCEGGELFEKIVQSGNYSEKQASTIMQSILRAVHNLHMNNICHRDLKPENFLFLTTDPDSELKLIDFGLSSRFGGRRDIMKTLVGTPFYVAPEVLKGPRYGPKCDLWSAGVIMYVLISGRMPFSGASQGSVFQKIETGDFSMKGRVWQNTSSEAKDLISNLLEINPEDRIDAETALKHPWFETANPSCEVEVDPTILESLESYKARTKMEKLALAVIVKHLSYKDIKDLKSAFTVLDTDNSGYLTFDEIEEALVRIGEQLAGNEIREIIRNTTNKGQGRINYSEFLAATLSSKMELNEEMLWFAFKHFDIDNSGFITAENVQRALTKEGSNLELEEIAEIIREVDIDEIDGKISYEEFRKMFTN